MARSQSHHDLPFQANRAGRAGVRWAIMGLVAMLSGAVALGFGAMQAKKQATATAAIAAVNTQLLASSVRVGTDPAQLLSSLQQAQSQASAAGLELPQPVRDAISQVANQATPLAADAPALRLLADQAQQFDRALEDVASTTRALRARQRLMSDRWGQALGTALTELSRPELASMPSVFAPVANNQALQKQWAARFAQVGSSLVRLPDAARQDASLSQEDRQALSDWVDAAQRLASSARALSEQAPLREKASQANRAAASIASTVQLASPPPEPSWLPLLTWAGWSLLLVSLGCWLLVASALNRTRHLALDVSEESRESIRQIDAIDRLMRQIQKVVPPDGPVMASAQVDEPPGSALFPVATGFNRLADALLQHQRRTRDQANDADYALTPVFDGLNELATIQQQLRQALEFLEQSGLSGATQAAGIAQRLSQLSQQVQSIQENVWRSAAMLQERGFRMDALRESSQDIAKRIKRLGESSQSIGLVADRTHAIGQQMKVVAINIAIEAATAGAAGQPFTSMAQEVQRLSQAGAEQAQELYGLVELLVMDASEVATTMEAATSEVVESGRLSEQTETAVREVERLTQPLASDLQKLVSDLEKHALALSEGNGKQAAATAQAGQGHGLAGRLQEAAALLRQKVRGVGRDGE